SQGADVKAHICLHISSSPDSPVSDVVVYRQMPMFDRHTTEMLEQALSDRARTADDLNVFTQEIAAFVSQFVHDHWKKATTGKATPGSTTGSVIVAQKRPARTHALGIYIVFTVV
ncbi:hypothetical protein KIPB_015059, partial [Kipferlia bialata]